MQPSPGSPPPPPPGRGRFMPARPDRPARTARGCLPSLGEGCLETLVEGIFDGCAGIILFGLLLAGAVKLVAGLLSSAH